MKRSILFAVLLTAVSFTRPAFSQIVSDKEIIPYIETSVNVNREVVPDQIVVQVNLSESDSKGKIKIEELDRAFVNALKSCNIDIQKSVVLQNQSSSAIRRTGMYGYKNYLVTLSTAEEVNDFFSALEDNQIRSAFVSSTSFSKKDQVLEELRIEAVKQAQNNASSMAVAIGQTIGSAILIQNSFSVSSGNSLPRAAMAAKSLGETAEMDSFSPLSEASFKKIRYSQSVTVKFRLNPKNE